MEDRDEVDGVDVGLVFAPLAVRELSFAALTSELVDARLRLPVEAQVNQPARDLWRQDATDRVEQPVEHWGVSGFHVGILHRSPMRWKSRVVRPEASDLPPNSPGRSLGRDDEAAGSIAQELDGGDEQPRRDSYDNTWT